MIQCICDCSIVPVPQAFGVPFTLLAFIALVTTASRQGSVHTIEGTEPEPWTREVAFEELQKRTWQVTRSTSMSALDGGTEEAEDVPNSPGVQRKRPEETDIEGMMDKVAEGQPRRQ